MDQIPERTVIPDLAVTASVSDSIVISETDAGLQDILATTYTCYPLYGFPNLEAPAPGIRSICVGLVLRM